MSKVYYGDWASTNWRGLQGKEAMERDFNETLPASAHILFAYYGDTYGYDGQAYVLFEQDGKLFEVAASHCSCYGLDGMWSPNEMTPAAVRSYFTNSSYYVNDDAAHAAVLRALDRFEQRVEEKV